MAASYAYSDPLQALGNRRVIEGEAQRKQTEINTRNKQNQIAQDEFTNNALMAQRYALNQSNGLASDPNNPRTITDTSMTISNGGGVGGAASAASRRTPSGLSGAGGGAMPPQLDGKYMPLVNMPEFNPSAASPLPAHVGLGANNYAPEDATAYQNAAFSRLKDKSGALGQSAISSLASQLGGRGIGNSGTMARGTAREIVNAVQPLADLNVAHLGNEYEAANRSRQMSENARMAQYQGDITQRNQDMSTQLALDQLKASLVGQKYQGGIQQRGQDLEALYRLGLI